jgi:hypothetical protein
MAKHQLGSSGNELDFQLFSISTSMNQYEAVSAVNAALGTDLALEGNVPMNLRDGNMFSFSLFGYTDESLALEYLLVPNASNAVPAPPPGRGLFESVGVEETTRLVKELPRTDYFLIVKGETHPHLMHRMLECLQAVEGFIAAMIRVDDLPSRKNLIF